MDNLLLHLNEYNTHTLQSMIQCYHDALRTGVCSPAEFRAHSSELIQPLADLFHFLVVNCLHTCDDTNTGGFLYKTTIGNLREIAPQLFSIREEFGSHVQHHIGINAEDQAPWNERHVVVRNDSPVSKVTKLDVVWEGYTMKIQFDTMPCQIITSLTRRGAITETSTKIYDKEGMQQQTAANATRTIADDALDTHTFSDRKLYSDFELQSAFTIFDQILQEHVRRIQHPVNLRQLTLSSTAKTIVKCRRYNCADGAFFVDLDNLSFPVRTQPSEIVFHTVVID